MKNTKKLPTKQLEKFSTVFMQLGFVLTLFIVYVILEHQTEVKSLSENFKDEISITCYGLDETKNFIFKKEVEPKPKVLKKTQPLILDDIKKGDDDIIETKLPDIFIINDDIQMINQEDIIEHVFVDPFEDDIDFKIIEDAPIYKGCEGLSKEENKICFEKKIKKLVQRNFNAELAQEIGLHTGKHKIYTEFIIDKTGEIVDVRIRAPHQKLKQEVQRIINKIPKFTPGKQRSKPVKVRYTLPIAFSVE